MNLNIHDEELLRLHIKRPERTEALIEFIRERGSRKLDYHSEGYARSVVIGEAADLLEALMREKREGA